MRDFKTGNKNLIRAGAFVLVLFLVLAGLSVATDRVLMRNEQLVPERSRVIYRMMKEPEESIDVVVLGNSLSYAAISPMILWKDCGIASYVCGQPGQTIQEADQMLSLAISAQTPDVVIVETGVLFGDEAGKRNFNDSIEAYLNFHVPLYRGHNAWKSLVERSEEEGENYKGFSLRNRMEAYKGGPYMLADGGADAGKEEGAEAGMDGSANAGKDDGPEAGKDGGSDAGKDKGAENGNGDRTEEISETVLSYLEDMTARCEKSGAALVLLSVPSPLNHSMAKHNAAAAFADAHGLPYIDMNLMEDLGINWEEDFLDGGDHLNLPGAIKATARLEEYLTEHFSLPDHRGEAAYESWQQDSKRYEAEAARILANPIRG